MSIEVVSCDAPTPAEVYHSLQNCGYGELRKIGCRVEGGVATLSGRVSSFYLKQIAQSVVSRQRGIQGVVNLLEVH